MYYFNNKYLKDQTAKLIIKNDAKIVEELEIKDRQRLFVFLLDVENSVKIPKEIYGAIVDNLSLLAATDVSARGGIVFNQTDGIEAFFKDGFKAVQSAMSLYHRKEDLREKIFKPIIDNQYHMSQDGPPINWQDINFRICLFEYPQRIIHGIIKAHRHDHMTMGQELISFWKEAESRFANKQEFLITKEMFNSLKPMNRTDPKVQIFFNKHNLIHVKTDKPLNEYIEAFYGEGFYHYTKEFNGSVLPEEDLADVDSAQLQEDRYKSNYDKRRRFYPEKAIREGSGHNFHLFDYFKIEPSSIPIDTLKVAVFGDINLDYITYLKKELVKDSLHNHFQIRQDIKKQLAGKGINIAKSLAEIDEFEPILLIGKLGMDLELHNIVQELKQYPSIKPLLFISDKYSTGTTICIRNKNENSSILTITDKPNANSDLTYNELKYRFEEITSCDYFFISGYCLLDNRIEIIKELIKQIKDVENKRIVLEFSPKKLWSEWFAHSPDRQKILKDILEHVFLITYEDDVFPKDVEGQLTKDIEFKIKFTPDFNRMFKKAKHQADWTELMPIVRRPGESLGLINKLTANFINEEFLRPKILLCSKSPRRFNLLSSIYGSSFIQHYKAFSPEYQIKEFNTENDVRVEAIKITIEKLSASIKEMIKENPGNCREIKVAISSDLVVVISKDGNFVVLDKPDNDTDPIRKAKECLSENLSKETHVVLTCTCFLNFDQFVSQENEWVTSIINQCTSVLDNLAERENNTVNAGFINRFQATDNLCRSNSIPIEPDNGNIINTLHILLGKSNVVFRDIREDEIEEYIASGEWRTKAGGYAIQGNGAYFVDNIEGLFTNIVGFPVKEIVKIFSEHYGLEEGGNINS